MEIGSALKTAREKQAISLEVAEKETKIRKKYLIALEEENFDIIPGKVYVRGFLRNYARFLGLNGEYLVNQYNNFGRSFQERDNLENTPVKGKKESNILQKGGKSFNLVALVGLVLFAGVVLLFFGLTGGENEPETPFAQQNEQFSSPHVSKSTPPKGSSDYDHLAFAHGKDEENHNVYSEGINLALTFDGRCWMEVTVDEEEVFEGFAHAGETREFSGREIIAIRMGNAGVVKAKVNGEEKGYLGKRGQVVQKVFRPEKEADT